MYKRIDKLPRWHFRFFVFKLCNASRSCFNDLVSELHKKKMYMNKRIDKLRSNTLKHDLTKFSTGDRSFDPRWHFKVFVLKMCNAPKSCFNDLVSELHKIKMYMNKRIDKLRSSTIKHDLTNSQLVIALLILGGIIKYTSF